MQHFIKTTIFLILIVILYFLFYPTDLELTKWHPPKAPALEGEYARNELLSHITIVYSGQCDRCEDIAIDSDGNIYGGEVNGNIKMFKKGSINGEILVNTGGRPLGLHFDREENLIIADAYKGILSLTKDRELTTLTHSYGNYRFRFADDLEIDSSGIIYFSDASNRFGYHENNKNIIEHQPAGSFYAYDTSTGETSLLGDSLYFPNGIAVDHEDEFILVNETFRYQLSKYWLRGKNKGSLQILKDNLPGFPDGISKGSNGIFWIAFASTRLPAFDDLLGKPFLRATLERLPTFIQPKPVHYGIVLGIDKKGRVVYNFQDPNGKFSEITSVQEFGDKLYLGSLYENGIGVLDLGAIK